ncbi:cell division protein PerM [Georgenia wangjunii]|uniref:cell division protein PerM n=1 Tax=Georgenia wangjunii TaxID=3117730 RepID=UPI002F25F5BE
MSTTAAPPLLSPSPTRRVLRLPSGWLRSTITGVEAAVLSWLAIAIPAVAAYVATAAAPVLGEAGWVDAARAGTSLWLLGQGGTMHLGGGGTVSLTPLGLSLLSAALVYGGARRARLRSWGQAGFTTGGYVLAALVISAVVPGPAGRLGAVVGAAAIAALGAAAALRRARARTPERVARAVGALPASVRAGVRGAGWAALGLLALAVVAGGTALATGAAEVSALHEALGPEPLGGVILVLAQLLWLPSALVWALAWVAGPGFVVGTGTLFSTTEVVTAPLPAVPLLGALPGPGAPGLAWVLLGPVLVGAAVGWWLHRRRFCPAPGHAALSALTAGAVAGVVTGLLCGAASGAIGPGRMAELGAPALAVAGYTAATVTGGALVVVLALHPATHALLGRAYAGARTRLRRDGAVDGADAAARD